MLIPQDQYTMEESITVIVPVYRSKQTLKELHRRLVETLKPTVSRLEIIFVDDGGEDGSWDIICELAHTYSGVQGLKHSRNYGQHSALLTGIRAATCDIIVTLDDDLQNPPEEIPKILKQLAKGYDVAYGTPQKVQHGFFRNKASQIIKIVLQNVMGEETADKVSTFRAFRTSLRTSFADYNSPNVSIDALLTWGTTRFTSLQVMHDSRKIGNSNYTLGKLVRHTLNMLTGFSILPLRLASLIGFLFTLLGFVLLAWVLIRYFLHGNAVAGFPFLASIISIFSGAQMFALGIIGEYMACMHLRNMGKPAGVVCQSIGPNTPSVQLTSCADNHVSG